MGETGQGQARGRYGGILDHVDMDDTILEDLTAPSLVDLDEKLDMAEEQLEAQLNNFLSNQEVNSLPTEDGEKPY